MSTTRIRGRQLPQLLAIYFIQLFMYPYFLGAGGGGKAAPCTPPPPSPSSPFGLYPCHPPAPSPPPQSPPPLCECRVDLGCQALVGRAWLGGSWGPPRWGGAPPTLGARQTKKLWGSKGYYPTPLGYYPTLLGYYPTPLGFYPTPLGFYPTR